METPTVSLERVCASAGSATAFSAAVLHRDARPPHIDEGEEEQPHDVDEVPVPGGGFEAEVMVGREVAAHGANKADDQEDRADDDMRAVEAGRHEEGRAVDTALEGERRVRIFVGLHTGEENAEQDRECETLHQSLA